jgi:hypothetical protein
LTNTFDQLCSSLTKTFEHRTVAGRHTCMVLERQGSPLDYVSDV